MTHSNKKTNNRDNQSKENEIIYGKHPVLSFLESDEAINKLYLQKGIAGAAISDILKLVKENGFVIQEVPKSKLDELTGGKNHQGVVATIPSYPYSELSDIFELAEARQADPFILILDGIEDPHNLGSIIRTADAMGVHGIIIPKRRSASLTGVVAKVAAGALQHVPVVRVTNLAQTIQTLKERGVWIFATEMDGEDIRQWNSSGSIAIIIGNEGQGVSRNLLDKADGTITIPMVGHVQSLNASVATGMVVYEVARHRIEK